MSLRASEGLQVALAGPGDGAAAGGPPGFTSIETSSTLLDQARRRLARMRRGVITSARLHQESLTEESVRFKAAFVTVTYRPGVEWSARHVSDYVRNVRMFLTRRKIPVRLVWVLELQQRGAPHYHLMVWLPKGITLPMPDKSGWWPHGRSNIRWARKAVGYLAKYASKGTESAHRLPKGARLWAQSGLRGAARECLRWWLAPRWLRAFSTPGDVLRRVTGWWENRTLGIAYRSPWVLDLIGVSKPVFSYIGWKSEDIRFF